MNDKYIHLLNGKFVGEEDLVVSVNDLGFSRGYAVFDFFVTYNGKPFMLDLHLQRLLKSANHIGLSVPWCKKRIKEWVLEILNKNDDGEEKAIKVIISGGKSLSLDIKEAPTIAIVCKPRSFCNKDSYQNGIVVVSIKHARYSPEAKSNNYIEAVKQIQKAKGIDVFEPIYYDEKQVFEGSNSNVFAVIENKLLTPKSNILEGVTRKILLDILNLTIPIEEQDFSVSDLISAKEIFITGSNKEVMPVTKIDGLPVGNGKVGKITNLAIEQFRDYTLSDKW